MDDDPVMSTQIHGNNQCNSPVIKYDKTQSLPYKTTGYQTVTARSVFENSCLHLSESKFQTRPGTTTLQALFKFQP